MTESERSPAINVPRKHHIIPAFYLTGFTARQSQSNVLHVFDYTSGKRYLSTPLKACRESDFYRVEEPGYDVNHTELALGDVEATLAKSVKLVASGAVADRPTIAQTLEFSALCAGRNRRARQQTGPTLAASIASRLRRGEMSREEWEKIRASELRNGANAAEVPPYDEAVKLLLDTQWFPRAPTVLQVGLVFEAAEGLRRVLMKKRWETHVTDPSKNGGFVCSDNPLVWGDINVMATRLRDLKLKRPVSLSDDGIEVTFPVSRSVALVSYSSARESRCQTTDKIVAHVNSRTLHASDNLIFHAYDDFLTEQKHNVIRNGSEYFAYVAEARRKGIEP